MAEKKVVLLTDLALHTRPHHPTHSFARATEKATSSKQQGRVYGHLPKPQSLDIDHESHTIRVPITLPPDLMEQWQRGEVDLALPEGGIPIYAGKDTQEYIQTMSRKERRRQQFKKHRTRTWHAKKKR